MRSAMKPMSLEKRYLKGRRPNYPSRSLIARWAPGSLYALTGEEVRCEDREVIRRGLMGSQRH